MLDNSARLLRLLTLLQARRYWSGPDLAARLEVTPRSLRRDMQKLRELGYPVDSSTGRAGGYGLGAGSTLPPLLLQDDEVLAVVLGLRVAAAGAMTGMEETGLRALAKLEQLLPMRLRKRAHALYGAVAPLALDGPAVDLQRLSAFAQACRDHVRVEFSYQGQDGASTERRVQPHALVCTGSRWYLLAWDELRNDWRTFRIDRTSGKVRERDRFMPRPIPGGDAAAYIARSLAAVREQPPARLLLHAPLGLMATRIPKNVGSLEHLDAKRCVLQTTTYSPLLVAAQLAAHGVRFEVIEPPALQEQVRAMGGLLRSASPKRRAMVAP